MGQNFSVEVGRAAKIGIQAKLRISSPGDVFEQEAERVANEITRVSATPNPPAPGSQDDNRRGNDAWNLAPHLDRGGTLQRSCAGCSEAVPCAECAQEEERVVLRKSGEESSPTDSFIEEDLVRNLEPGIPLDESTRVFMESRLGNDFRQVRVHTGESATKSARAVNALAYTVGKDVVFGADQFKPSTLEGKRLLAHELAHVVQQSSGASLSQRLVQRQPQPQSNLKMPVVLHYVSKTNAEFRRSGSPECTEDVWSSTDVTSVNNTASGIMAQGFGIDLTPELDDLGCISLAKIVDSAEGLNAFINREVTPRRPNLDSAKTHVIFVKEYQSSGGAASGVAGDVATIGGNTAGISRSGSHPGRTMAHELGHTLNLNHPDPPDPNSLMSWGQGTAVSAGERRTARAFGTRAGRLKGAAAPPGH